MGNDQRAEPFTFLEAHNTPLSQISHSITEPGVQRM